MTSRVTIRLSDIEFQSKFFEIFHCFCEPYVRDRRKTLVGNHPKKTSGTIVTLEKEREWYQYELNNLYRLYIEYHLSRVMSMYFTTDDDELWNWLARKINNFKPDPLWTQEEKGILLGDNCSICFEKMIDMRKIKRLKCYHYYHKKCIEKWLDTSATCPCCRDKVDWKNTKIQELKYFISSLSNLLASIEE